ncbi:MAG: SCP2 sterol-binding domain-containing protein [Candidatus Bipolaricaulota bacterium]|nr:SCP2 sterol-binding domain-containing protein [Candidatus Bipolaricaulota bacterium]MCS7274665.1 SCP2 sterol-binding domain-containing protein [Candidatus Bipolaricaulota bacterium]MDW8111492.1 SCP2 sterol-binding domain-containing protein [Candidatus Bipolaricaulota bacterium]MDW8329626.1 SCP2 sterol-binding domain-containing protein [Candidatus Bipolaricaulota bacterium]
MGFPYTDPQQAKQFVLEFANRLKDVKEIYEGWSALKMLVGIHIKQPDIDFWVDARGDRMQICETHPGGEEDASLTLTADLFHKLYTGQENALLAFTKRQIHPKGRVSGIIQLTRTMPHAVQAYKQFLSERGL